MKNTNTESVDRIENLNSEIDRQFAGLTSTKLERRSSEYDQVLTEMIEVTRVGRTTCDAIHVFDDFEYVSIRFPPMIHQHLAVGDVFLVTIGKSQGDWWVVFTSPRYETEIFSFDENSAAEEVH